MARILLGVSGSVAAYKALELVRLATGAGHAVRVIQTPASQRFVGAASFAALSGAPVLIDEFEHDPARGAFPGDAAPDHEPLSHLELVRNADVLIVAPASANTIAKLAHGFADNLLTSAALAARCPLVIAPAMNNHMWEHPASAANVELLRARGARIVAPGEGRLGSVGEWGVGRLAEPAELLAACESALGAVAGPLAGLRVLVSAGGTREPIDAVRYVGNRSSGRMGFALAAQAAARGAQVTVVAANVALPRDAGVRYVDVATAAELEHACREAFAECDVLLMSAAVADFRPSAAQAGKIKKDGRDHLALELAASGERVRRSSVSRPSTARERSNTRARSSSAKASTRSSSTTSRSPGSALTRPRTRSRSSSPDTSSTWRGRTSARSRPLCSTPFRRFARPSATDRRHRDEV